MTVKIDRERAALYGLDAKQIENALYSAYGPELTSNIYTTVNQYQVLEEMKPKYQEWTEYLSKILLQGGQRAAGSAGFAGQGDARRGAAEHRPFGRAALGDDFLQPEDRRQPGHRGG